MGLDVGEIGMGADLSLDLRHFASKAMKQTGSAQASDMDAYIRRLEEERGKIEVFRRELPICARLLADAIDVMKEEAEKEKKNDHKEEEEDGAAGDKSKWMSTAQLWTSGSGREAAEPEKQESDKGRSSSEQKSFSGGALTLFNAVASGAPSSRQRPRLRNNDDKAADVGMPDLSLLSPPPITSVPAAAADESRRLVVGLATAAARASGMVPSAGGPTLFLPPQVKQTTPQQQQQARKSRRCWSPELHRQFVAALNKLGGLQVATPRQIRELMKVEGLTNDEVKSHLQKYRLHTRRTPSGPAVVSQPIVLVGGLWIPHQEHSQSGSQSQSSGSPQGPLHFSPASGVATASCEEEASAAGPRSATAGNDQQGILHRQS